MLGGFPEGSVIDKTFAIAFGVDMFVWGGKTGFAESVVQCSKENRPDERPDCSTISAALE